LGLFCFAIIYKGVRPHSYQAKANQYTLKKMVGEYLIKLIGKGRGSKYIKTENNGELMENNGEVMDSHLKKGIYAELVNVKLS